MWQWIVNSVLDVSSPIGISREFFQNLLAGILAAFIIAPATALAVRFEDVRRHRKMRLLLCGALYFRIVTMLGELERFTLIWRNLMFLNASQDWLLDAWEHRDDLSERDITRPELEDVLPSVFEAKDTLERLLRGKGDEVKVHLDSASKLAEQTLRICRQREIEPLLRTAEWLDRIIQNVQLISLNVDFALESPEKYFYGHSDKNDGFVLYLFELAEMMGPLGDSISINAYRKLWRDISKLKHDIRAVSKNTARTNLDESMRIVAQMGI
jgi:hypothetical protein